MDEAKKKEFLLHVGSVIRDARKTKGFSQAELADELGLEISQVSRIERGVINPKASTLLMLNSLLDLNFELLFDFK